MVINQIVIVTRTTMFGGRYGQNERLSVNLSMRLTSSLTLRYNLVPVVLGIDLHVPGRTEATGLETRQRFRPRGHRSRTCGALSSIYKRHNIGRLSHVLEVPCSLGVSHWSDLDLREAFLGFMVIHDAVWTQGYASPRLAVGF